MYELTFNEAASDLFAAGTCPDGYFGDRMEVYWHFHERSGKTVALWYGGCFIESIPPCVDKEEAAYWLFNHPSTKDRLHVKIHCTALDARYTLGRGWVVYL